MIYRNRPTDAETCVLNWDGTMDIYAPGELDIQSLIDQGAYQSWVFGPGLLDENGKAKTDFVTWDYIRESHPRTAIGYYEPGHYCLVLVDGRQETTRGMFSFMTFQNRTANHPYKPEHEIPDGIFITEAGTW